MVINLHREAVRLRDETYLGDSVYASFDGCMIRLRTDDIKRQIIYLDDAVVEALFNYVHALKHKGEGL
jgi:hypothetical protein